MRITAWGNKVNMPKFSFRLLAYLSLTAFAVGCGGYSALPSGSQAPSIVAEGWTNGGPPEDLAGNVIVLEMFATW